MCLQDLFQIAEIACKLTEKDDDVHYKISPSVISYSLVHTPTIRSIIVWINVWGAEPLVSSALSTRLWGEFTVSWQESQLGPRPVALRLWVHRSEGQVDAWTSVMVLFSHLMLVETERQIKVVFYVLVFLSRRIHMKLGGTGLDQWLNVFSRRFLNSVFLFCSWPLDSRHRSTRKRENSQQTPFSYFTYEVKANVSPFAKTVQTHFPY